MEREASYFPLSPTVPVTRASAMNRRIIMAWSKAGRAPGSPGDKEKDLITFKRQLEGHFGFASFLHLSFLLVLTPVPKPVRKAFF